jgi:Flp pilus assembly pilin Flp
MNLKRTLGQSILEYTLVLGAAIAVIVFVLLNPQTGIKKKVQDAYVKSGDALSSAADGITSDVFQ